ncbi:MAG: ABC transporter permease [ANME-2 cluster archaeon]|nr:ABC transporter permease [ANME-2 cluster archaeon]
MKKILSMACLELVKSRSVMDRRVFFFMVLSTLIMMMAAPTIDVSTFSMTKNLYIINADGPPLDIVLSSDPRFRLVNSEQADLTISSSRIQGNRTQRSMAALSALDETVKQYRNDMLEAQYPENDPGYYSAFPVWVDVTYLDTSLTITSDNAGVTSTSTASTTSTSTIPASTPTLSPTMDNESPFQTPTPLPTAVPPENISGTPPGDITPPFPLTSVLVSFLFVAPMFFVSQLYSSSIMDERISRKGVMLLVSPIRGYEIVAGKTLPYFTVLLVFSMVSALVLGGDALVVLVMIPVILIFLSTAFLSSILARNFRELTMMLVFFSVVLGSFLFIPTAFVNIHEYSTISPLTVVVNLLEGDTVTLENLAFASLPLLFASLLTYLFCTLLMNEEGLLVKVDAFEKVQDSVGRLLYYLGRWQVGVLVIGMLVVPFVFLGQLFLLVIFFNMMAVSPMLVIGISMALSVMVEEWAKVLAPLVLLKKGCRYPVLLGMLSGMGYFLGEKGLLLLALSSVVEGGLGELLFVGTGYLLVVPLFIHVTGVVVSSKGIAYGISPQWAVAAASLVHFTMNLIILWQGGLLG